MELRKLCLEWKAQKKLQVCAKRNVLNLLRDRHPFIEDYMCGK